MDVAIDVEMQRDGMAAQLVPHHILDWCEWVIGVGRGVAV